MSRDFLGWHRPLLESAAERILDAVGNGGPLDLRRFVVALPGGRAGRRLSELLVEGAERRGRPLRPPRIVTIGGLPESLYRPPRPIAGPVLGHSAWIAALRDLGAEGLASLLSSPPAEGRPHPTDSGWSEWARTLAALQAEVGSGGHDFRSVAATCRQDPRFSDEERWSLLSSVQERVRALLASQGLTDREAAREYALEKGPLSLPEALWVVGGADLPQVVQRFLEAAGRAIPVRILIGAPPEYSDRFGPLGTVLPEAWVAEEAGVPDRSIRIVSGPAEQAEAVLDRLRELDPRPSAQEVTLGVPDPDVVPFLLEGLGRAGVPVRRPEGLPLEASAPFRLLEGVAAYLESRDFDRFSALLRHPEFEDALRREMGGARTRSLPAIADRYRAIHLPGVLDRGWLPAGGEPATRPVEPELRRIRDAFLRLLEPLDGMHSLSGWASRFRDFLLSVDDGVPLVRSRPEERMRIEVMHRFGGVLRAFAELPPALDPPVGVVPALRRLLDELRGEGVPPPADEDAVEALGWLELVLDDAPVLVLTGANEPHLPESVTSDPFLPHGLRRALGLLDNDTRRARDLLFLQTLLATRPDTRIVLARRDAKGNTLRPSRLLLAESDGVVARRVRWFLGEEESGSAEPPAAEPNGGRPELEPSVRAAARPVGGGLDRAFALPPEPVLSAPGVPNRISVTAFRALLADPYRYALERVLGLRAEDDHARELDGAGFGVLAHAVLERFGREGPAASGDPEQVREALRAILDDESRSRFGTRPLPAVRIQVRQLARRLEAFGGWQAGWAAEGWRIRGVEMSPPGEGVRFDVDGSPILLRGMLDRVDRNEGSGEWCLLDYKTGDRGDDPEKAHRRGRSGDRRWIDLQLPLYRKLAPALRTPDGAPLIPDEALDEMRVGFVNLPRDPGKVGVHLAEWSPEELDEAEEEARRVVRRLRANRFVFDADAPAIPGDDPLAAVVGGGVLGLAEEPGDEADGEGDSGD